MPERFHDRALPARQISDQHWVMARRVARELDKILDGSDPRRAAIKRAAAELRLTTRQIYNLLARYRADRTVTALLPRTASSRRKRLPEQVEEIIAAIITKRLSINHP